MSSKIVTCLLFSFLTALVLTACGTPTTMPTTTPIPTQAPISSPTIIPTQAPSSPPALTPTHPAVSGPGQPSTGYGGQDYVYSDVVSSQFGKLAEAYYIFEPKNVVSPTLPVIIFLHGYNGVDPNVSYLPWIQHLVKRGNIVIFPVFQLAQERDGEKFSDNALVALKDAFAELQNGKHVRPELDKLTVVGYSAGGVVATNYTMRAAAAGLPIPKALFAITPGGCANCSVLSINNFLLGTPDQFKNLPADLKMVVLVGDRDSVVGLTASTIIWQNSSQLPAANRSYVQAITDSYGSPGLIADHSIANHQPPNAYNYYGTWKIQDALQSCALKGKGCEYALGGTPQQRDLGKWSDGQPIIELKVLG